jgi:hypothetical protein
MQALLCLPMHLRPFHSVLSRVLLHWLTVEDRKPRKLAISTPVQPVSRCLIV